MPDRPCAKASQVVLFEGYMDVIKAWSAGVNNGVATMGTALTEEHAAHSEAAMLMKSILCYDGDNAGQAAALKINSDAGKAQDCACQVAMLPKGRIPMSISRVRRGCVHAGNRLNSRFP